MTDIIGRSESDIKKAYLALKIATNTMGLRVNEEKAKYMVGESDKKNLVAAPYLYRAIKKEGNTFTRL
jgi:hypothetical protein